jgi:hypothetical protein
MILVHLKDAWLCRWQSDQAIDGGEARVGSLQNTELLNDLYAMCIGSPDASLSFSGRLAVENDWTENFASRVEREYKRFLYLAVTCGHAVTPSDEVDQAWHLHLTYSRHYWDVLCHSILKRPLHHGPTEGGSQEGDRYRDQYAATLQRYEAAFGAAPPVDIWPSPERRFAVRYRRLATGEYWVLPKKGGVALLSLFSLTACTAGEFEAGLIIAAAVAMLVFAFSSASDPYAKRGGKDGGSGCGGGCGSGCGGGCGC